MAWAMMVRRERFKVVLEGASFVLRDPDADKITGQVVALRQRMQGLARNVFQGDLTLEFDAVGAVRQAVAKVFLHLECTPDGGQIAGWELTGTCRASKDGSHGQARQTHGRPREGLGDEARQAQWAPKGHSRRRAQAGGHPASHVDGPNRVQLVEEGGCGVTSNNETKGFLQYGEKRCPCRDDGGGEIARFFASSQSERLRLQH